MGIVIYPLGILGGEAVKKSFGICKQRCLILVSLKNVEIINSKINHLYSIRVKDFERLL